MIETVVFDLDGTLVQTEKLKARSYGQAARILRPEVEVGQVVEAFKEVVGRSRREVAEFLLGAFELAEPARARMDEFGVGRPWQSFVQIRLGIYEDLISSEAVISEHRWPFALELLDLVRSGCDKVGLATMSHCPQANRVLNALGLKGAFDFVATRDDVEQGKPDPEIYQLVLSQLDAQPERSLAIEDSPSGVRAALAAGMEVVAVATDFTRAALHGAPDIREDRIVDDPANLIAMVDRVIREKR